ncbi:MAG: hypothetical protein Q9173_005129 [Seirophora scorigena]
MEGWLRMLADIHSAFKIQAHKMFLDTNFNSVGSVLQNMYQNFTESAMKLALTAFEWVLSRKQTKFGAVLGWVREALGAVSSEDHREAARLMKVARKGQIVFQGFRY